MENHYGLIVLICIAGILYIIVDYIKVAQLEKQMIARRVAAPQVTFRLWNEQELEVAAYLAINQKINNHKLIELTAKTMERSTGALTRKLYRMRQAITGNDFGTSALEKYYVKLAVESSEVRMRVIFLNFFKANGWDKATIKELELLIVSL